MGVRACVRACVRVCVCVCASGGRGEGGGEGGRACSAARMASALVSLLASASILACSALAADAVRAASFLWSACARVVAVTITAVHNIILSIFSYP